MSLDAFGPAREIHFCTLLFSASFINGMELSLDITTAESEKRLCLKEDDLRIEMMFRRNAAVPGTPVQGKSATESGRYRVSQAESE